MHIQLPYDSAIPLLGIQPNEWKAETEKDICIPVFVTALFPTPERWNNPYQIHFLICHFSLVGGLLQDLAGVFLGDLEWNFGFWVWKELRDWEKHREEEGGKGKLGALWNSCKLASYSLTPVCISLNMPPRKHLFCERLFPNDSQSQSH